MFSHFCCVFSCLSQPVFSTSCDQCERIEPSYEVASYFGKQKNQLFDSLRSLHHHVGGHRLCSNVLVLFVNNIDLKRKRQNAAPQAMKGRFNKETAKEAQKAWAKHIDRKVQYKNSHGITMVLIPPGEFMMGADDSVSEVDEKPIHKVHLSQAYFLSQTEVTREQWKGVMGTSPWNKTPLEYFNPKQPATNISWSDANEFCIKLTKIEHKSGNLPKDWEYSLPTEAQWEYACRAGTTTNFYFGDAKSELKQYAWCEDNTIKVNEHYPHLVGKKTPNQWGLYDMHGNAAEWCLDWYGEKYYESSPVNDPSGPIKGEAKVFRSGYWFTSRDDCRSAKRYSCEVSVRVHFLGFRIAQVEKQNSK